jgi:uncharacterized protein (TIGR03437 family)
MIFLTCSTCRTQDSVMLSSRVAILGSSFSGVLLLAAVLVNSPTLQAAGCTSTYNSSSDSDHGMPLPGTTQTMQIDFGNQGNALTPNGLVGVRKDILGLSPGDFLASPWHWFLRFPTGDPKHPNIYRSVPIPKAEKAYNQDCPGGPYIDFSGGVAGGSLRVVLTRVSSAAANPAYGQSSTLTDFASFNADGNTDVVALSDTGLIVQFLDATSSPLSVSQIKVSTSLYSVIAADVNGDGFPDLVAVDGGNGTSGSNGGVWILLNQKNGTFGTPVEFPAGPAPYYVFAADFNGDGKLDLVVSDGGQGSTIAVLLGNGNGTFRAPKQLSVTNYPGAVVAADFNNDGHTDIAVLDVGADSALIFLGNGDGTFQQPRSFPSGPQTGSLVFGDFNQDGFLDLAGAFWTGNQTIVFLNDGTGGLKPSAPYLLGDNPTELDFSPPDSTGFFLLTYDDISNTTVVTTGNPDGTLGVPQLLPTLGTQPSVIAAGDVNGDGLGDAVVLDSANYIASVFTGVAGGTFKPPVTYSLVTGGDATPAPSAAALIALRAGGKPDLVIADQGQFGGQGAVLTLLNNGSGAFGPVASFAAGSNPVGMVVGDLNGDGKPDVAVADNGGQSAVAVLLGDGQGNFGAPAFSLAGLSGVAMASADVNGDGKPDLIVGSINSSQQASITVLLNSGGATFKALAPVSAPSGLAHIVAGDFNGDGKIDLALIGSSIQILLGKGNGSFTAGASPATAFGANTAVVADLNGDGHLDLVVGHCCGANEDTYLLGNGDGTFQPEVNLLSGPGPTALALADWTGDGVPSLAIADSQGAAVPPSNASGTPSQGGTFLAIANWFGPTIVSGASFQATPLPSQSIATAVGQHLATTASPKGTKVQVTDFAGNVQSATIFYSSPTQVNFLMPSGLDNGPASVLLTASDGTVSSGVALVQPIGPGIFMLNAAGLAAADVIHVSGGKQTVLSVYQLVNGAVVANPIDLGSSSDQNVLVLFGTGFRTAELSQVSVTFNGLPGVVEFAGSQPTFAGLDQANVVIPQNAGLHGNVVVALTAAGIAANSVNLTFQ